MQETPAELRNAAARRLMARNRFREALDVLNEAIRIDPRFAESYDNRAVVFERLGMLPQADADRRKVAALGGVRRRPPSPPPVDKRAGMERRPEPPPPIPPPTPEPPVEAPTQLPPLVTPAPEPVPEAPVIAESPSAAEATSVADDTAEATEGQPTRRRVVAARYPVRREPSNTGPMLRSIGTMLISFGLLAAAGIGIYLALTTIGDALDGDNTPAAPGDGTETGTPDASGGASATSTTDPEELDEALGGAPLSFTRFQAAWQGKGITATPGDEAEGLRGFGTTPVTITLTRAGETMEVALLFYDSPAGPAADFDLSPTAVTPKTGRTIPAGAVVWYNANVVAVVLETNEAIHADARDSFFNVSA